MAYFQPLDIKKDCNTVYLDGEITPIFDQNNLTKTWNYSSEYDAKFAELYVQGKSIEEVAPPHLANQWKKIHSKKLAFINSFQNAKIDLNKHCFYDLVPTSFLLEYNYIKTEVTKYVFENYEEPLNYEFLKDLTKLTNKIASQPLKLNRGELLLLRAKTKSKYNNYIDYNIFGTVTGRLASNPDSFPILTLNKKYRSVIEPQNGIFIELDINAADLRGFFALLGKEQPTEDLHQWNIDNVFKDPTMTRQEAKVRFFAWFYNPNNYDKELQNVYSRDYLLQRYFDGKTLRSPFGRTIETDDYHALSYLVQGAANDIILRNILKIDKLLTYKKSFVSFMIHDSVVIDLHPDDISLLDDIYKAFTETEFGNLVASMSYGSNFGDMNAKP